MKNKKVLVAVLVTFALVGALVASKALARSSWG
jgi:hypothetical protein